MQTNNTLIFANNNFVSKDKKSVKDVKIIIKSWKYFIFIQLIKFKKAYIKFNLNSRILTKKRYKDSIFFIIKYNIDFINSKKIIKKKLLLKK